MIPELKFAAIPTWCAISGLSRTGTYHALGRGDLKAIKVGSRTLIDVEAGSASRANRRRKCVRPPTLETTNPTRDGRRAVQGDRLLDGALPTASGRARHAFSNGERI